MNTPPLYNPLSGIELKQLILKRAEQILTNSGKFEPHITYPNVQFYLNLQVHLPITQDRDFNIEKKIEEAMLPPEVEAETISLEATIAESTDNPPDKIRDDNLMPISIPKASFDKHTGLVNVVEEKHLRSELASKAPTTEDDMAAVQKLASKLDKSIIKG